MAITWKTEINEDIWGTTEQVADVTNLQAKDFAKWLRKQIRLYGRNFEICDQHHTPVEIWVKELGQSISFICGGEVVIQSVIFTSDWRNVGYYMFDDEGEMVVKASEMLRIIELENPEAYLIAR